MSGSDGRWAELSSQNEHVAARNEPAAGPAGRQGGDGQSRWAALASQRERLVDSSDPEFQLANSGHARSARAGSGMRLVASAA